MYHRSICCWCPILYIVYHRLAVGSHLDALNIQVIREWYGFPNGQRFECLWIIDILEPYSRGSKEQTVLVPADCTNNTVPASYRDCNIHIHFDTPLDWRQPMRWPWGGHMSRHLRTIIDLMYLCHITHDETIGCKGRLKYIFIDSLSPCTPNYPRCHH